MSDLLPQFPQTPVRNLKLLASVPQRGKKCGSVRTLDTIRLYVAIAEAIQAWRRGHLLPQQAEVGAS
jgi:hypothetical protein